MRSYVLFEGQTRGVRAKPRICGGLAQPLVIQVRHFLTHREIDDRFRIHSRRDCELLSQELAILAAPKKASPGRGAHPLSPLARSVLVPPASESNSGARIHVGRRRAS